MLIMEVLVFDPFSPLNALWDLPKPIHDPQNRWASVGRCLKQHTSLVALFASLIFGLSVKTSKFSSLYTFLISEVFKLFFFRQVLILFLGRGGGGVGSIFIAALGLSLVAEHRL